MPFAIARRPLLAAPLAALACAAIGPALAAEDATWPHTITEQGGSATIYEPQAISWPDLKTLTARTAVAITPAGSKTPIYGTIELTLATDVDVGTRSVTLTDPKLISASFPDLDPAHETQVEARIRAVMAEMGPKHLPLDTILLSLKEHPTAPQAAVNNDPPKIFFSNGPALLVVFDGVPVLAPVEGTTFSYAVNTNWDVFKDAAGTWYLRDGVSWLSGPDATGPFAAVRQLPAEFGKLPSNANFDAAHKTVPPKPFPSGIAPRVDVSTVPAEIIVTRGQPQFVPVTGTGLQRVANTDSILYFDPTGRALLLPGVRTLVRRTGTRRALDLRNPRPAARVCQAAAQPARLGSRHATGPGGGFAGAAAASGHAKAERDAACRLWRTATLRSDPRDEHRIRRQHALSGAAHRRHLLLLLSGRLVPFELTERAVGAGR